MLTETILFYHDISAAANTNKNKHGLVDNWAARVQEALSVKPKSSRSTTSTKPRAVNLSASGRSSSAFTLHSVPRTTSSSTAVVTSNESTNNEVAKRGNFDDDKFEDKCGFLEEGEDGEREGLLSSPAKGNCRPTSNVSHYNSEICYSHMS